MRGNRLKTLIKWPRQRSIPACAGEPSIVCRCGSCRQVYPRVCGGTFAGCVSGVAGGGLSPRVRGNRGGGGGRGCHAGSIPACAGEPAASRSRTAWVRVYPRVCGGTGSDRVAQDASVGLSPRVRGNRPRGGDDDGQRGSIPACAGEPRRSPAGTGELEVYPRVCGGTMVDQHVKDGQQDLSPRVRGNQAPDPEVREVVGSIPACAGEPQSARQRGPVPWVYPRVCGGTACPASLPPWFEGLSPRVRGNLVRFPCEPVSHRSIPACAGEPSPTTSMTAVKTVYPRVCGGTPIRLPGEPRREGLSPRVRGNRQLKLNIHSTPRSIPACAGEPQAAFCAEYLIEVYPRVCGGTT